MAVSATSPSSWFVSELGETLPMAPPPYSYDPNGSDLPRGQRSCIVSGCFFFLFVVPVTQCLPVCPSVCRLQSTPVLLQSGSPGKICTPPPHKPPPLLNHLCPHPPLTVVPSDLLAAAAAAGLPSAPCREPLRLPALHSLPEPGAPAAR